MLQNNETIALSSPNCGNYPTLGKIVLPLLIAASLSGCFRPETTHQICDASPEICLDLNDRGWCRYSRANIIHARYQHQLTNDLSYQFEELLELEEHVACMSKIAQIISTERGKETEHARDLYHIKSLNALTTLQQETRYHLDPALSFYHWLRFDDDNALERFLEGERKGKVSNTRLKRLIGIYYFVEAKPAKAQDYLLDVIEAAPASALFDNELLTQLAFVLNKRGDNQNAFLFNYLAQYEGGKTQESALAEYFELNEPEVYALIDQAQALRSDMRKGQFSRQQLNL